MKLIVTLCVALAAACSGKSRCEALIDKNEAKCVEEMTRKFYVDGKEAGQLQSDEEARKGCKSDRAKHIATCEKWPKEVLECAEKEFSAHDEWQLPKCQQILEDSYNKTHAK